MASHDEVAPEVAPVDLTVTQPGGVPTSIGWEHFNYGEPEAPPLAPTSHESLKALFRQYYKPYRLVHKIADTDFKGVGLIGREEGYDPIKEGLVDRVDKKHVINVLSQPTRKQALAVIDNIQQEQEDMEILAKTGVISNFANSIVMNTLDPSTWLPIYASIKTMNPGMAIPANFKYAASTLAPAFGVENAFLTWSKETKEWKDWASDTAIDTFMGAAIGAVAGKYASHKLKHDIDNNKAYFKAAGIGLDIIPDVTEGTNIKLTIPESSLSGIGAAEAKNIEALLNSGRPAFHNNPFIKHIFGLGSPIIKGVTSRFPIMHEVTTALWGGNFRTASGDLMAISDPGAINFINDWKGIGMGLRAKRQDGYLEWLGIEGAGGQIKALVGTIKGEYKSQHHFNELVAFAFRRGTSTEPIVHRIAQDHIKAFKQLFEEAKLAIPGLQDHEYTNIVNHLIRLFDKDLTSARPDDFTKDLYRAYSNTNQKLIGYLQPLNTAKSNLEAAKEQLKAIKGKWRTAERRKLEKLVKNQQQKIKALNKKMQDDKRSGVIGLDMLQARPNVTPKQKQQLDALTKPYKDTLKKLKKAKKEFKNTQKDELYLKKKSNVEKISKQIKELEKKFNEELSANDKEAIDFRVKLNRENPTKTKGFLSGEGMKPLPLDEFSNARKEKLLSEGVERLNEFAIKGSDIKSKYSPELKKLADELDVAKEKLSSHKVEDKSTIRELRKALKAQKEIIKQKVLNGEIADDLLYTDRFGRLWPKDPDRLPDLRPIRNVEDLKKAAMNTENKVNELTEEQSFGAMFEDISGNTPTSFRSRDLMVNDAVLERWLVNDMDVLSEAYINSVSKFIYYEKALQRFGGEEGVNKELLRQFTEQRDKILEKPDSPVRKLELFNLKREYKSNQKLMSNFKKAMLGGLVDYTSTRYKLSNALRQFTSSALLTNLPILALSEFVTPTFKMGYDEFVHDGLVGALGKAKQIEEHVLSHFIKEHGQETGTRLAKQYVKNYYADCLVAVNRIAGEGIEARFGWGKTSYEKSGLERFADVTTKLTDTASGASRLFDLQESMHAHAAESQILRTLFKYVNGETLEKAEIHMLDELRLNPRHWAKRIVDSFNKPFEGKTVGQKVDGGYISNHQLWDDFDAAQRFRIAIKRRVDQSITKPGPADVPFIFKDPTVALFAQFLSWPFAATQNFLLPTLTEFDRNKLFGIFGIMAAASLISPLRQLSKGQEVDMSFEALANSALNNSGLFGWQYDLLSRMLAYMHFKQMQDTGEDTPTNKALRIFLPERHKGKGLSALFGSPALGVIDMMGEIVSSGVSGEFNQQAALNSIRLLAPYLYTTYTQDLWKKALEQTSLPKNRREARAENE